MGTAFTAEAVRRFFVPNDWLLLAPDMIAFIYLMWAFPQRRFLGSAFNSVIAITFVIVVWSLTTTVFGHQVFELFLIGIRPIALFVLSVMFAAATPFLHARPLGGYVPIVFLTTAITVIGIVQIILGVGDPINQFDYGDERMGIGTYKYDAAMTGGVYIFRPTSIFSHTGKFGQILFFTTCLGVLYHVVKRSPMLHQAAFVALALLGLAVSGQRAAMIIFFLLIMISVLGQVTSQNSRPRLGRAIIAISIIAAAIIPYQSELLGGGSIVIDRAISGVVELAQRVRVAALDPLSPVIEMYGLVGVGGGYFTLGSTRFGGELFREAENSWLRQIGENGVVGFVLVILFWVSVFRLGVSGRQSDNVLVRRLFVTVFVGVCIWANTHDVMANVLGQCLFGAFVGEIVAVSRPVRARRA